MRDKAFQELIEIKWGCKDGVLTLSNLRPCKKEEIPESLLPPPLHADTAGRQPTTSQEKNSRQKRNPGLGLYSLQNSEKINVCGLSHPVYGTEAQAA